MMSLQEKNTKSLEEQRGMELTDEEVANVSGGDKEIFICRNDLTLDAYMKWVEPDGGRCNNCHLYFKFKKIEDIDDLWHMAQFYCREFGAMREGLALNK